MRFCGPAARFLCPQALVAGAWTDQLVDWIGPIIGGGAAGWLYSGLYIGEAR